ncbi:MAG: acetylglutamate kinase [Daejeonella sp.]|uniref:acetylglutamate kinase n=1 Tax=Daejeonella sp. TaxID=2805397 RepID=UPI0027345CC9|nr:acetylglutamate kinase [Daejeonella sp.]MDP3467647.1 acetylglutamate kinase [Daejeonella sp.]
MKSLKVIKIGGNVIDNPDSLQQFIADFAMLQGHKILVHGGGKIATKIAEDLGIKSKMVEGRRITDGESLKVVTMVYAGLINKNIVAGLQSENCNAIGLSGADGNMIRATRRLPQKVLSSGEDLGEAVDYGFVGDLDESSIDRRGLYKLLEAGFTPVFSAITHDGKGQLLNTNADTIASAISIAMSKEYETSLIFCFEKAGVLMDIEDEGSVIRSIDPHYYNELKRQGIINDGMIPKLDNAFEAINKGLKEVCIGKADALANLNNENFGTRLISR